MKYHGLSLQPMQESGAFLLRAMQNEEMPRLDLLVRESVQNALDAALDRQRGGEVRIDFHLRDHATETVASLLAEGIDRRVLLERFPAGGQLLEIRDSLTEGLTGPLCFEEIGEDGIHGNLLKLVYEIGRTRIDDGAGGSWGLGKTCYFRMGIGLVFYYSRIRLGDGFQERLVASLVEDETRHDRLQSETRTGIGWWGAEGRLRPVTGTAQVRRTLDMLRVRPFTGTETGTSIIIPFLRDDLVPTTEPEEGAAVHRPWWYDSYDDYMRVALERWFCARLDNPHFATGPRLTAAVNGEVITAGEMQPIFRVAQALYNRAIDAPGTQEDYLARAGIAADALTRQPVAPRGLFTVPGPAGDVAAVLLTPEQLGMVAPLNHYDPATCVYGRFSATPPHRPLVTFMRRPGMAVCWDDSTESRGWAGGFLGAPDGRYLVAVFVPRQDRFLAVLGRRARDDTPVSLESYLRSCERADHAAWQDVAGLKIVDRIRAACGRILARFGSRPQPVAAVAPSIRMARNLADLVLPERGMGTDGRTGRPSPLSGGGGGAGGGGGGTSGEGTGGGGHRRRSASASPALELLDLAYTAQGMQVRWLLGWGSMAPDVARTISLKVDSESGPITLEQWRSDGLGPFPFRVLGIELEPNCGGAAGAAVIVSSNANGDVLLRAAENGPVDTVRGVLLIGITDGGAGTLRPLLAAALAGSVQEQP